MKTPVLLILIVFIFEKVLLLVLDILNLRHQKQHPEAFYSTEPDSKEKSAQSLSYLEEKTRLSIFSSIISNFVFILVLFSGVLSPINQFFKNLPVSALLQNLILFESLVLFSFLLEIPEDLYLTFVIEEKYKFNRTTSGLWISDQLKSLVLQVVLIALLGLVGFLILMYLSLWWVWIWVFFLLFSLFILVISPYVIEPLFYHFTPLENPELSKKIQDLFSNIGIEATHILVVDASRRSNHTNAYFTGLGKQKRIVLFDTLLEKMDSEEIIAILAHEAGHWKHKHLLKTMISSQLTSLIALFLVSLVFSDGSISHWFGLNNNSLIGLHLILITFVFQLAGFWLAPLSNLLSRKHEFEADRFSADLTGHPEFLIRALKKLSADNLSHPAPHPLYVIYHYSHPPVSERIQKLSEDTK